MNESKGAPEAGRLNGEESEVEMMETVRTAIQELILPDLTRIREENKEIKIILTLTNKRLDDVNLHLADQSRRIDAVRDELVKRIDGTNKRIDDTNKRMDDTNKRMDGMRDELVKRIDDINKRMDRLYDVVVRREEHAELAQRLIVVERDVAELKRKIAA